MAKGLIKHAHIMDLPLKTARRAACPERAKKLHVPFHILCHRDLFHLVVDSFIVNQ